MNKLILILKYIINAYKFSTLDFINQANFIPYHLINNTGAKKTLLLPLIDDYSTMCMITNHAKIILNQEKYLLKYFFVFTPVDSDFFYQNSSIKRKFYTFISKIYILKLCRIYSINYFDVIFSNYKNFQNPDLNFYKIDKLNFLNYKYGEVLIGDLAYDHYLRFYKKPTVDTRDINLISTLKYAENLSDYWSLKFKKNKIDLILLPYSSYLHWGIISRIGLYSDVKVLHFGSSLYFFQNFQKAHIYHSKNFKLYKQYWSALENKEARLVLAESSLNHRLKGDISDILYMKKSSFLRTSNYKISSNTSKNIVIFLHCFFDSPNIYGGGLFVDFYVWIEYLLDFGSKNTSISYFVKPHPNGVDGNEAVVESFKRKYSKFKNIIFLNVEVSNLDIQDLSPNLIVTYYGTVAQEFSYLGFPVVLCGDSPMKYYSFTYQPETLKELDDLLLNVGDYKLPDCYDKEEILQFYYMHYMYYSHDVDSTKLQFSKNFTSGDLSVTEYDNVNSLIF